MTKSFVCPHNDQVTILDRCPIEQCPYHFAKVSEIFDIPAGDTNCAFYDTTLMSNISASRTQISALSRNSTARISSKAVRSLYDDALGQMRTLYVLTHNSPKHGRCCSECGYPLVSGFRCVSTSLCRQREQWSNFIITVYGLTPTPVLRELVWESFVRNEISCANSARETGEMLLSSRDNQTYEHHRKQVVSPPNKDCKT